MSTTRVRSSIALADSTTNGQINNHFCSSVKVERSSKSEEEEQDHLEIENDCERTPLGNMADLRTPSVIERLLNQRLKSEASEWSYETPSRVGSGPQSPDSDYQSEEKRRGRPRSDIVKNLVLQGKASPSSIKCQYCARVFPREKSLQAHLRTHTGEKPYKCDYPDCGRAFTQSGQLKTHQRLHAGEKPFVCSEIGCSVRFTHANRHCPTHPNAVLRRSHDVVLRTVVGSEADNGDLVKEWMERYKKDRELSFKVTSSKLRTKTRRADTSAEQEQENYSHQLKVMRHCLGSSDDEGFEDGQNGGNSLVVSTPSTIMLTPHIGPPQGLPLKFQRDKFESYVTPMGNSRQSNCIIKADHESPLSCWSTSPVSSTLRHQKLKRRWLEAALIQTENVDSDLSEETTMPVPMPTEKLETRNDEFYHSRPSVLVMATASTKEYPNNSISYETITLHKVQEDEGEVISSSGLSPYKMSRLDNPVDSYFEHNQYASPRFTTHKYIGITQDNHSRN